VTRPKAAGQPQAGFAKQSALAHKVCRSFQAKPGMNGSLHPENPGFAWIFRQDDLAQSRFSLCATPIWSRVLLLGVDSEMFPACFAIPDAGNMQVMLNTELTACLTVRLSDPATLPEGFNAHIFPDGEFAAEDGRPAALTGGRVKTWRMDAAVARKIAALASAEKPILYDYEHNSAKGRDSRAAGWIDRLVHVPGKGLYAHVDWTPQAAEAIKRKEYRYSSPYFSFDAKTGALSRLLSVALTNTPALTELDAVGLHFQPAKESEMDKDEIVALTVERDSLKTQLAALNSERDALKTALAALEAEKQKAAEDAAKAALAKETAEKEALLAAAAEKLTPPLRESLKTLSVEALKTALAALPPSPLVSKQADGKSGAGGAVQLTAEEKAMCAKLGVSEVDFVKAKTPANT
jgi:phage I-like protein